MAVGTPTARRSGAGTAPAALPRPSQAPRAMPEIPARHRLPANTNRPPTGVYTPQRPGWFYGGALGWLAFGYSIWVANRPIKLDDYTQDGDRYFGNLYRFPGTSELKSYERPWPDTRPEVSGVPTHPKAYGTLNAIRYFQIPGNTAWQSVYRYIGPVETGTVYDEEYHWDFDIPPGYEGVPNSPALAPGPAGGTAPKFWYGAEPGSPPSNKPRKRPRKRRRFNFRIYRAPGTELAIQYNSSGVSVFPTTESPPPSRIKEQKVRNPWVAVLNYALNFGSEAVDFLDLLFDAAGIPSDVTLLKGLEMFLFEGYHENVDVDFLFDALANEGFDKFINGMNDDVVEAFDALGTTTHQV